MMKVGFIFGTRPEIIKLSSLIRECIRQKVRFFTIHTGQHYTFNMSELFLKELGLPEPDYCLKVKSKAPYRQGDHTGRMMVGIEEILLKEMPDVVLVQGDTNSALAGALTASKISTTKAFTGFSMKVGHVEAGLRSYDRGMPEEINRVLADHLSDFLFAPTKRSGDIMISEGIMPSKVYVTGNTVVDALYHSLKVSGGGLLEELGLKGMPYMLLTLHRQENVDSKARLAGIFKGLKLVSAKHGLPIIFPVHPRTVKKLEEFGMGVPGFIRTIEPCGFLDFIDLEANAALILTDSGGLQEEACALGVPCVTLRDTTERPETVDVGANIVAGVDPEDISKAASRMMKRRSGWKNPFGKGDSARKILGILKKKI